MFKSLILTVLSLMLLSSCGEADADISKPKSYNKNGLSFQYPGNWEITDDVGGAVPYIIMETPGDTITIVQSYSKGDFESLKEFAIQFASSMKSNVPVGEVSASKYLSESNEEVDEEFKITLFGESVPHRRKFRAIEKDEKVCYLIYQTPKEDFSKTTKGFDLISDSFEYK